MRLLLFIITLGSLGYGAWQITKNHPEVKEKIENLIPSQGFHTLEIRYTAEQIMNAHQAELLKTLQHKYLKTELQFHPHLLMEVKFCANSKNTQESLILWDLSDGEMVIETKGWEKTHGFGDCIRARTNRHEFKIINLLSKKGGACDRDDLLKTLHLENNVLDALVESLKRKQLVVFSGNQYRLHLQDPLLKTAPSTKINESLVTKTWKNAHKTTKRFSLTQIIKLAEAAFGENFAIRHTSSVWLPVHRIVVQNPDGSQHTSLWNALNGKQIQYSHSLD